ncbi:MAG: hypothetical protein RIB71_12660 [Imperialibacter sp.]|uniref:hypothetical protein n=1 Tax=Imperialibacter sp. TaxID=2038411 RepID=UPI0032EC4CC8
MQSRYQCAHHCLFGLVGGGEGGVAQLLPAGGGSNGIYLCLTDTEQVIDLGCFARQLQGGGVARWGAIGGYWHKDDFGSEQVVSIRFVDFTEALLLEDAGPELIAVDIADGEHLDIVALHEAIVECREALVFGNAAQRQGVGEPGQVEQTLHDVAGFGLRYGDIIEGVTLLWRNGRLPGIALRHNCQQKHP